MSIGLLASIRAGITTLTGRLTSGRATALDNLDATVSSRAASATALSTATWTGARAGYLDKIGIKSIQQGTVSHAPGGTWSTNSSTATITAVNTSYAFVLLRGHDDHAYAWSIGLTNSTTVTAAFTKETAGAGNRSTYFTVIEFNG